MNEEKVEEFLLKMFGEGFTSGEIILENNDTSAQVTSRDFDILFDFIHLNCDGSTVILHTKTTSGEVVAAVDLDTTLSPSFEIVKGDVRIPVYLADDVNEFKDLPSDNLVLPLPGVDGWSLEVTSEKPTTTLGIDLNAPMAISIASDHTSDVWTKLSLTRGDLIAELMNHVEGKKEGTCLLQGWMFETKKATRKASMMMENYIISLDLDNGTSFKEIDDKMAKTGLAYVRYTTHSHNSTSTDVSKKQYAKFHGDDAEVSLQGLKQWLHDEKGYLTEVCATAESFSFVQKVDGDFYTVKHGPVSKNRVIVFLKEPFQLRGEKAIASSTERWKERYLGFAESTGLTYDRACTDAARLFYMPRHGKDRTDFESKFFDGKALDIFEVTPVKPSQLRTKARHKRSAQTQIDKSSPLAIATSFLGGAEQEKIGFVHWNKTHSFEIVSAIRDHAPEMILDMKAKNGKGAHITCPNEDMHSKSGGSGTYAVNASDSDGGNFELFCTHAHCIDLGKLGLLELMVERGDYFNAEILHDEEYAPSLVIEEEEAAPTSTSAPVQASATQEVAPTPPEEEKKKRGKDKEKVEGSKIIDALNEVNKNWASVTLIDGSTSYLKFDLAGVFTQGYQFVKRETAALEINARYKVKGLDKSMFTMWQEWPDRQHFFTTRFDPESTGNSKIFTTFAGYNKYKAKKGNWELLRDHLLHTICKGNEEHYHILMTWFAHMVQRPWQKPGFALVFSGGKGTGKSLIGTIFMKLLDPYVRRLVKSDSISGRFNAHFDNNILAIAEEASFAGDLQADSFIKSLITELDMEIESKGIDSSSKKNYTRVIFTSNFSSVIRASAEFERRYFCFELPHIVDLDQHELRFQAIHQQLETGGYEAFLYELENWTPKAANGWEVLRHAPVTAALAKQQRASLAPLDRFYVDLLAYGYVSEDLTFEEVTLKENERNRINYATLKAHYSKVIMKTAAGRYMSTADFHDSLRKYLDAEFEADTTAKYILTPPLQELRDRFNKSSQMKIQREEFPKMSHSMKPKLVHTS